MEPHYTFSCKKNVKHELKSRPGLVVKLQCRYLQLLALDVKVSAEATIASVPDTEIRVRKSIRTLSNEELDRLITAFHGIQNLDPEDDNSFFKIAGYHGEPFAIPSGKDVDWGGYCFHNAVLFPTWHRAYCLRIEDALRSIPGCKDVTLPYWDELAEAGVYPPIPEIFTARQYKFLNGKTIDNPLYSYKLQKELIDDQVDEHWANRYTKHKGYETVRFPLAGLVGTEQARVETDRWNQGFSDPSKPLNCNIRNWFNGDVRIRQLPNVPIADTTSVIGRIKQCLDAPNYTVFSNKSSAVEHNENQKAKKGSKEWVTAVEEPHNAIHLALGGNFTPALGPDPEKDTPGYNANDINFESANGDMGANETAAFDPIFFIHHCFIDYLMWGWQKKHKKTTRGSLEIDHCYKKGTAMTNGGNAALGAGERMEMSTPLKPFLKPNSKTEYWTSDELTNISDLDYEYQEGSLELGGFVPREAGILAEGAEFSLQSIEPAWESAKTDELLTLAKTATINKSNYEGSFVIRTFAHYKGEKIEIGRDAILSRYHISSCENCQNDLNAVSVVPIYKTLVDALETDSETGVKVTVEVQHQGQQKPFTPPRHGFMDAPEDGVPDYQIIKW